MKKIFLFLIALTSLGYAADTTGTLSASGAGTCRLDSAAGLTWSPAVPSTPFANPNVIIVLDATSAKNTTMGGNISVKQFIARAAYTGAFSDGGYSMKTVSKDSTGSGGTVTRSGIDTMSGDGKYTLTSSTTVTIAHLRIVPLGTDTISDIKGCSQTTPIDSLYIAPTGKTTLLNGATFATKKFISLGSGVFNDKASQDYLVPSSSAPVYSFGAETHIGTATLHIMNTADGAIDTLPAATFGGTVSPRIHLNSNRMTAVIPNRFSALYLIAYTDVVNKSLTVNIGDGITIGAGGLNVGNLTSANDTFTLNCGSSIDTTGTFLASYNNATASSPTYYNFQTSQWVCTNAWTFGSNWTVNPGTSFVNMAGSVDQTVTSANKAFYKIRSSQTGATARIVLGDSLTAYRLFTGMGPSNYGGLKTAGFNVNLSASWPDTALNLGGASPCSTSTSAINIIGNRPVVKVAISTTLRQMKLSPWSFFHGVHLYLDSNYIFYRMYCPSDTMWIQNGRTPKDSTYTARDWHNLVMRSDVQGSPARINIPAAISDTIWARDIKAQGAAIWDTFAVGTGQNQGGDSNFYFKTVTAPIAIYYTPSTPSAGTVSPATAPAAGGTTITLTGWQELFAPCSGSVDGGTTYYVIAVTDSTSGTMVTPAHAAGAVGLTVKNADGNTVTKAAAYTYTSSGTTPPRHRGMELDVGLSFAQPAYRGNRTAYR